jgi:hypothetical protein
MSSDGEGSAFDSWYNGLVGFHINSERILDDLDVHYSDAAIVERWMKVCWNNALEAVHEYNGVDVEALKA